MFQFNAIPDVINGIELDYHDKQNIILGKIEDLRCYNKGLETFSISDNNTLQYWNLKENPISIHEITTADALIYDRGNSKLLHEQSKENKVKVVPLSIEQKIQYIKHFEAKRYNIIGPEIPKLTEEQLQSIPDFIDGKSLNEFNKTNLMFEQFSTFNDNKIYTINSENLLVRTYEYQEVRGHFGTCYKKNVSLVNDYECSHKENLQIDYKNDNDQSAVQEPKSSYQKAKIDDDDREYKMELPLFDKNSNTESYLLSEGELFRITAIRDEEKIYFQNVQDKDENITHSKYIKDFINKEWDYYPNISEDHLLRILETKNLKTLKFIIMEDLEKAKKMEVIGNERPLKVGDPISIQHNGQTLIGKVLEFKDNGDVNLSISNSKDIKELSVNEKVKIEPMFTLSKDEKMIYLKFTYDEALAALNKKSDISLDKNATEKSPIFSLMVGNKTDVISFEKKIDDKMATVQGRLELRRKAGTGEAYVHGEIKHKELNLNLPIYGLSLSENQKETLLQHKDLGLVEGFKNKEGKEYALWVSLDEKLNKVVTAPQNSININQIFGVKTTEEQRQLLKRGQETKIEIKGKEYLFKASAATTKGDGLTSKVVTMEKSENLKEEEKKIKSKGMKM